VRLRFERQAHVTLRFKFRGYQRSKIETSMGYSRKQENAIFEFPGINRTVKNRETREK